MRALQSALAAARVLLDSQLDLIRQLRACDLLSEQVAATLIAENDQLDAFLIDRITSLSGVLARSDPDKD